MFKPGSFTLLMTCFFRSDMETFNLDSILTARKTFFALHCFVRALFWFLSKMGFFLNFRDWNAFLFIDMVATLSDLIGRCVALQIQTKKNNQKHQNSIKLYKTTLTGSDRRWHCAHQNMQSYKMNVIQHIAWDFYRKYSDVTPM